MQEGGRRGQEGRSVRGRISGGASPSRIGFVPGWIGPWELALFAAALLFLFGAKRLPEVGRSLGRGMREFKDAITGSGERPKGELAEKSPEKPA
jgi:sec-independent protein translocase protein TatA